jgi:hypothetical protein
MSDSKRCETCIFFVLRTITKEQEEQGIPPTQGTCHRYPVSEVVDTWHWCGEHKRAAEEKPGELEHLLAQAPTEAARIRSL